MAAWVYPCNIPSVESHHPELASNLSLSPHISELLRKSKVAGDVFDVYAAREAENIAELMVTLASIHESSITHAVVETAKNRAYLLRLIHASREYPFVMNIATRA